MQIELAMGRENSSFFHKIPVTACSCNLFQNLRFPDLERQHLFLQTRLSSLKNETRGGNLLLSTTCTCTVGFKTTCRYM